MTKYNWRHRKSLGLFSRLSSLCAPKPRLQDESIRVGGSNTPNTVTTKGKGEPPLKQSTAIQGTESSQSLQLQEIPGFPDESPDTFGDSERTKIRYNQALKKLEKCLSLSGSGSEPARFLEIDELCQYDQITYLREQVDKILESRGSLPRNSPVLQRIFKAVTPISKCLLTVAIQGQPV
jgi:hypothetical protein